MNVLKHIAIGILSALQSLFGIMVLVYFDTPDDSQPIVFYFIALAGLAFLTCWIKGERDMGLFLGIPEFLLSPVAFVRFLVGTLAWIFAGAEIDYEESCMDPIEPLQKLLKFLFGFCCDNSVHVTKLNNIMTHIFICLPVTGGMAFCFWGAIHMLRNDAFPLIPLFMFMGITLLSALLCAIRGQESEVCYYHGNYVFKNQYSGKRVTKHTDDKSISYDLTDEAREYGWERTSSGYGSYYTGWMIFTMICSPILFFTQAVGLLFALISSPVTHIYSSYTKLDYDEFNFSFFQRILHFLFGFVID